jgi:hypothetical protein
MTSESFNISVPICTMQSHFIELLTVVIIMITVPNSPILVLTVLTRLIQYKVTYTHYTIMYAVLTNSKESVE